MGGAPRRHQPDAQHARGGPRRLSVGSPLIRNRTPGGESLATCASPPRSSRPRSRPTRRSPRCPAGARSRHLRCQGCLFGIAHPCGRRACAPSTRSGRTAARSRSGWRRPPRGLPRVANTLKRSPATGFGPPRSRGHAAPTPASGRSRPRARSWNRCRKRARGHDVKAIDVYRILPSSPCASVRRAFRHRGRHRQAPIRPFRWGHRARTGDHHRGFRHHHGVPWLGPMTTPLTRSAASSRSRSLPWRAPLALMTAPRRPQLPTSTSSRHDRHAPTARASANLGRRRPAHASRSAHERPGRIDERESRWT
jgi:hypothetical protein